MAGYYSGKDGAMYVATESGTLQKVAKIRSWSFSQSTAVLETVSMGDTDRTVAPGIRSISGQCSIYYYQSSVGSGSGELTSTLLSSIKPMTVAADRAVAASPGKVKLQLRINDSASTSKSIQFYAVITGITMNNAVGEITSADVTFEADGAPESFSY